MLPIARSPPLTEPSHSHMLVEIDSESNSKGNSAAKGESLQERFARMRQHRIDAQGRLASADAAIRKPKRSQEERDALRLKFVAQVRSYLGVPYSKKYAVSEAPMYLDCCNLVRRCVLDLKDDFGFTIGHWNQSYQFDTLPVALSGVEEMRPGDLIFWAAEYNDPTKKPRKHNLVHVEVFLGGENGEMTIGSRSTDPDSFKGVAMHESFRTYGHACHNIRIFYRSIDTWLDGVCVSHCKECNWTLAERPSKSHTTANKYSLFGSGGVAGGAETENVSGNRVLGECVPEDAEGE